MKRTRQLHLWIGLICSVFILLQSITGLLLSEKALLGLGEGMEGRPPQSVAGMNGSTTANSGNGDAGQTSADDKSAAQANRPQFGGDREGGGNTSFIGIVKGLHEGKIGQTNVKWLIDLTALGMIVLTATGIMLSIKTLRAQSIQRKRRAAAER
ncbi:PepSY-associated TM helix domain-containing protein [Paenibacillus sp. SI8]|uniref:PepSY-associated TM helix domain-containing protein n=1 Tax=unclassified Paenibacillus TaxID=185978 RepID=UPI003465CAE6